MGGRLLYVCLLSPVGLTSISVRVQVSSYVGATYHIPRFLGNLVEFAEWADFVVVWGRQPNVVAKGGAHSISEGAMVFVQWYS